MMIAILALAGPALFAGCVYKLDTQQGNFIEEEKIDQIEIGWTRDQVIFLLGSPIIQDPFHQSQWDYVYYFRSGDGKETETKRVTIFFRDDQVWRIERHTG